MVTIRDVAKLAGVGVGTASRAISGSGSVSMSARKAVEEAVKKLNFRPSHIARALSKGQSNTIGVLVPFFHGYYFATALSVTERIMRDEGKQMVVMSSRGEVDDRWDDAGALAALMDSELDGILILGTALSERELAVAAHHGPPIAVLSRRIASMSELCFSIDHFQAGWAVGQHMIERGHRELATITGPMFVEDARLRHEGFVGALREGGVILDPALVVEGNYDLDGGVRGAVALLASCRSFTGLFCGNDQTAVAAQGRLRQAEVRPYVVGYDNMTLLDHADLKISSVKVPISDMVTSACAYLLNHCYGGDRPVSYEFPAELVVRDSGKSS